MKCKPLTGFHGSVATEDTRLERKRRKRPGTRHRFGFAERHRWCGKIRCDRYKQPDVICVHPCAAQPPLAANYLSCMLRDSKNRNYGWDVELTCSQCSASGVPRYEGWSPSLSSNTGAVRVYAKIACPKCGKRLTDEAARKLVSLFRDLDIPDANKALIRKFILRLFLVPAGLAFILMFGVQMDWWPWGLGTIFILIASAISIPLVVSSRNRQLLLLPGSCECEKPHPVFMGSLDDGECYRCFSCGRLMKVRE